MNLLTKDDILSLLDIQHTIKQFWCIGLASEHGVCILWRVATLIAYIKTLSLQLWISIWETLDLLVFDLVYSVILQKINVS